MSDPKNELLKLENIFNVKGKVALVTGGGSGIGLMASLALAVNGAKVYIVGRTKEKLDRVVAAHKDDISGEMIAISADITDKEAIRGLVDKVAAREKYLSILVNNAGMGSAVLHPKGSTGEELRNNLFEPEKSTFDDWTTTYRNNVASCYFMTTAFLPLLDKAANHHSGFSASVINIGSVSGIVEISQNHFSYNASKAAVHHLTKMLAFEITRAGLQIRVNAIAPGIFPSELTTKKSDDKGRSQMSKETADRIMARETPAGTGTELDMGNAVLFAATNQYITGQILPVDGGFLLATWSHL